MSDGGFSAPAMLAATLDESTVAAEEGRDGSLEEKGG